MIIIIIIIIIMAGVEIKQFDGIPLFPLGGCGWTGVRTSYKR
jgi:hypothetical protein